MTRRSMCGMAMLVTTMIVTTLAPGVSAQEQIDYEVHDGRRPQPTVITPGTSSTDERPGKPPSDAIVLFDGKDLSQWQSIQGGEAPWKVLQGEIQIIPGSGSIETRQRFGDMQLHLEWLEPMRTEGRGQQRGNSGVFLQGLSEYRCLITTRTRLIRTGWPARFTDSIRRWSTPAVRRVRGRSTTSFSTWRRCGMESLSDPRG